MSKFCECSKVSPHQNFALYVVHFLLIVTVDLFTEPSEDWIIEHYQDIEQLGVDNLQAAISRHSHMITKAYSETLAVAVNERKKMDVIVAALSRVVKQELMIFLEDLKSQIIPHVKHHEGTLVIETIIDNVHVILSKVNFGYVAMSIGS